MAFFHRSDEGGVTIIRLDRPPANAIDLAVTEEFGTLLAELERAPPKQGIVLTGTGATFSAGVDFKAVPGYTPEQQRAMVRNLNRMVTQLYGLPRPVVAAVNGHAMGGGFVLMAACDFRVAARGPSKLALAEVRAGIPYPACAFLVVEDALEAQLRRIMVLSGRTLSPEEALGHRLVDEIVNPADTVPRAVALVQELAALPGYRAIKPQLRAATLARMRRIVDTDDDPMLKQWV